MNSSTLRRLASDHAALHTSELPPHYLFPASSISSSIPDDLTQLTILLTGPQGTPYSQGLWKLCLKIPQDYPKNPPQATFRTRIWHPNVEENSGSVCVDTLKKDWESKLTLRDVLIVISCLLIQPNSSSALNATAGHLLQDDYESFSRQARLMTSIHASIPADLKEAALTAKRRGEAPGTAILEDTDTRPIMKGKSASSSSVVMKKKLPQRITTTQSAPLLRLPVQGGEESGSEYEDDKSASKENDPKLSLSPVPVQSPRRPNLTKRPLSDLPTPSEIECDGIQAPCLSPSDQNVVNNTGLLTDEMMPESLRKLSQPAERSQSVNFTSRGLQETGTTGISSVPLEDSYAMDDVRPAKRVCSDEGKENAIEGQGFEKVSAMPLQSTGSAAMTGLSASRKVSAPGSLGSGALKAGKARVGLRRL